MEIFNLGTVVVSLVSAIGGGFFTKLIEVRYKYRSDDLRLIMTTLQEDNKRLREILQEYKQEVKNLQQRVSRQELHLLALDASHYNHPWPAWIKDVDGTPIVINKAFEDIFLSPLGFNRFDYIGHNDYAIWDKQVADEFRNNDRSVVRTKDVWEGIENVGNNGSTENWWVVKYPIMYNREAIGIAGTAVPLSKILTKMNTNNADIH